MPRPALLPSRESPRSAPGRRQILDAALACFTEKGIAGTTLGEIRLSAGASVGGLYHHFDDKLDIAAELYVSALGGYQRGMLQALRAEPSAEAAVRGLVAYHVDWRLSKPEVASFVDESSELRSQPSPAERLRELNSPFFAEVLAWWRGHSQYGGLRELEIGLAYSLWLGPADRYCRLWSAGRAGRPGPEEIRILADAAWASVGPTKGD